MEEEKDELLQHFSVSVACKFIHVSFTAVKSNLSNNSNNSELLPKNTSATVVVADAAGSPLALTFLTKKSDFSTLQLYHDYGSGGEHCC